MNQQADVIDQDLIQQCANDAELAIQNLPKLFAALTSDDESLLAWTTESLENCGPPLEEHLPWLKQMLESTAGDQAFWGATMLGRLESKARPAEDNLARLVLDRERATAERQRAAWALGKIGPIRDPIRSMLEQSRITEKSLPVAKMLDLILERENA